MNDIENIILQFKSIETHTFRNSQHLIAKILQHFGYPKQKCSACSFYSDLALCLKLTNIKDMKLEKYRLKDKYAHNAVFVFKSDRRYIDELDDMFAMNTIKAKLDWFEKIEEPVVENNISTENKPKKRGRPRKK